MTRLPWTAKELAYLDSHYLDLPAKTISKALNRSVIAVYNQADKRGLRTRQGGQAFTRLMQERNRGRSPWNKGLRGQPGRHLYID